MAGTGGDWTDSARGHSSMAVLQREPRKVASTEDRRAAAGEKLRLGLIVVDEVGNIDLG